MKMSIRARAKKVVDSLFGTVSAPKASAMEFASRNRKQIRAEAARQQAMLSAPARRKYEKRGAPGRSSKGRKPHRVS